MAGRFSIEAVFKAIDKVSAPISRMQTRINRFTRSAQRGFARLNRAVGRFTQTLKRAAVVSVASLAVMSAAMANVITTGAGFEQSLVNAAARFPIAIERGTEAFTKLEEVARRTGATTEFTAAQAAEGLNFLALAGFSAVQSVAALPGVVDLATASQTDLASASNIATDALGAFGLATKDPIQLTKNLTRVSDVLAKTVTSANTDMAMLFETIKKGGPQVRASGSDIETFAALAGVMANSSLKASEAGSVIKNMFLRLQAPERTASRLIRRFAGSIKDADGNMLDMVDILANLDKGLAGLGTVERAAILDTIFGKRAITGVNILLQSGIGNLREFREELRNAGGTLKTLAGIMRDTTERRIDAMTSAFEGLKISMFLLNQKAIEKTIEGLTKYIRIANKAIRGNEELGRSIARDIVDVVVGGIKIIGMFVAAFLVLNLTLLTVNTVLAVIRLTTMAFTAAMFIAQVVGKAWTASLVVLNAVMGLSKVAYALARVAVLGWAAALAASRVGVLAQVALMPILAGATALASGAIRLFNLAVLANPVVLFVAAIGLLVGAAVLMVSQWGKVKSFFVSAWDVMVSGAERAAKKIQTSLGFIINPIKQVLRGVGGLREKLEGLGLLDIKIGTTVGSDSADLTKAIDNTIRLIAPGVAEATDNVLRFVAPPSTADPFDFSKSGVGAPDNVTPITTPEAKPRPSAPLVVSPQQRVARSIEEQRTTETAQLLIRDETGRAELERDNAQPGVNIKLELSGAA